MEDNALAQKFNTASLLRFTFPNMVMAVFLSLYMIVDSVFIARYVNTLALSAINMSDPLICIQMAIAEMLATGGNAVIARKMGEGKDREAREDFTCIVAVSLAVGAAFMVFGNLFLSPILRLLGTSAAQMPYCKVYTSILLWFAPAFFLQTVFQILFVTAGKANLGLGLTVAGGVANVVLDILFMGPMNMGVAGAAIATVISYCIPAVGGVVFFFWNRKGTLNFIRFPVRGRMLLQSCGNGASEMVADLAEAVTTFLMNMIFLRFWGEDGVAAIAIVIDFHYVLAAVYYGFSTGVAPVVSYKYGAADTDQLKRIFRACMGFLAVCSLGAYLLSLVTIGPCLTIFTEPDSAVYRITMEGFPLYAWSFLFMGVTIFASAFFTSFSNGAVSAVISAGRTFVFLVGALLILPVLWKGSGVWLAVPAAELLGMAVAIGFLLWGRKKYQY